MRPPMVEDVQDTADIACLLAFHGTQDVSAILASVACGAGFPGSLRQCAAHHGEVPGSGVELDRFPRRRL